MKWLVAIGLALALAALLPWSITRFKRSGRLAGAALAIGLAFAGIFDPKQAAAIETIKKKKEIGEEVGQDEPLD